VSVLLRASGTLFDVDAFVSASPLLWDPVWRRGERRKLVRKGHPAEHEESGATTLVAEGGKKLDDLVTRAIAFLRANDGEMSRLAGCPGVEQVSLDFAVPWYEDMAAQYARLPPDLLGLAGWHRFWIEISHYATAREGGPAG
jgi:hypothetical protein